MAGLYMGMNLMRHKMHSSRQQVADRILAQAGAARVRLIQA